jgi:hypothetical protein
MLWLEKKRLSELWPSLQFVFLHRVPTLLCEDKFFQKNTERQKEYDEPWFNNCTG